MTTSQDVTTLLRAWSGGDKEALDLLVPLVHRMLHGLAQRAMDGERQGHTLQPTALVNEVFLRLVDIPRVEWQNRAHFFALAGRLMRRILVDLARARGMQKRGGGVHLVTLHEELVPGHGERAIDLVALDDALEALARLDPRRSQVVELRFFGGLEVDETAEVLGISRRTVLRDWTLARTWLFREIRRRSA